MDSDYRINLPKLYKASKYLKRPEVEFLNGATDKVVPLRQGLLAIGRLEGNEDMELQEKA